MRCQDWYDAGNEPVNEEIVYRWRDGRPMRMGPKGFYIDCAYCQKEFESLGLRCSVECSERPTAIATLNCHRHLTPSCGGQHTYRGENSGPARMIMENLTPRPGIREHNLPFSDSCTATRTLSMATFGGSPR